MFLLLSVLSKAEEKESLIVEEFDNHVKFKKYLAETKLVIKKFTTSSNKLNEVLALEMRDPSKEGLGNVDKGKVVTQNLTIFVKALCFGECPKLVVIKSAKKVIASYKMVCHYCGTPRQIRYQCFKLLHYLRCRCVVPKKVPTPCGTSVVKTKKRV
ncbi:hypothetical protein PVK06_012318 [Gossypium arboreum]|uniref:Uncharacterized protein n=1 Tax=Gossypium arboreum TaxID=29729 RepID=A0ABR0QBT7_GOSAR|nr:hypothetical protein PVK06_012318 [Gossypium arboreum]